VNKIKINIWIEAARPKTLAAAFVPVLLGSTLAYSEASFNLAASAVAMLCAFLIQIGTNFANDYYDAKKGADTDSRIGFTRATATGLITPKVMMRATVVTMSLAFILGLYLVWHAGWVILVIGILSLIFGIAYTGGPYPLGYNGLGDVFVFIFFGIIAVMGTYYVNALHWSSLAFWVSIPAGALSTNILVINNLRDIETDKPAGKRTLGVIFGENALRWEYLVMILLSFAIPPHLFFRDNLRWIIFLPFITIPFAVKLIMSIWQERDKVNFNRILERTAQFMVLFGLLFSVGLIFS
jgi:1,4-dihydroxy-2-naphthoate octaprenyltransferase